MVVVGLVRDMGPRKFQEDPAVGDVYEGANTNLHELHWHPGWEVLPQVGPLLGPKNGSPTPLASRYYVKIKQTLRGEAKR